MGEPTAQVSVRGGAPGHPGVGVHPKRRDSISSAWKYIPDTNWALISQLFSEACNGTSIFSYFYQTNVFN